MVDIGGEGECTFQQEGLIIGIWGQPRERELAKRSHRLCLTFIIVETKFAVVIKIKLFLRTVVY